MTDISIVGIGGSCVGTCSGHPPSSPIPMTGKIVGTGIPFDCYGSEPALDGYVVQGDCGHTGTLVAGTSKITIKGKKVSMVGDSFSGVFTGTVKLGLSSCQVV